MASSPILNPDIPYVGAVESGLIPGKMVKIQGKSTPNAVRFAINYQLGPNLNPRDDIAIHISPRFPDGFVTRNHIESMNWGPEENGGPMLIQPGEDFEIIILCEQLQYKIAINGRHFTEFAHRLPYQRVTHLVIDGDVEINSITYEVINSGPPRSPHSIPVADLPTANFGPPAPGRLYPTLEPQGLGPAGSDGGYGPPPDAYGGPGGGYNPPRAYGYQPGYEKAEEEDAFGGCLDKVGLAVGGLIAAGGVAAAMHAMNKNKKEHEISDQEKTDSKASTENEGGLNLGALGTALASSLASSALQGDTRQSGGYPPQNSGASGVLGSIFGALGGGGSHQPQGYYPQQPPPPQSDPLGGALGSILGGVLGGGGSYQQSGGYGGYPQSGGYQPSGGYGSQQQGSGGGGDLLSGLGSAIGSSLLSSALDGLSKRKSHDDDDRHKSAPQPNYGNYGGRNDPPQQTYQQAPRPTSPPPPGGGKFSAADISKGLGLDDDED